MLYYHHGRPHITYTSFLFLYTDPATTQTYTLSLHDALPISGAHPPRGEGSRVRDRRDRPLGPSRLGVRAERDRPSPDRKSTRLNSSHVAISYAVFCLKKKKKKT